MRMVNRRRLTEKSLSDAVLCVPVFTASVLIPFLVLAFYSFHDCRISGSDSDNIVGRK
jgi:hypothetical protein